LESTLRTGKETAKRYRLVLFDFDGTLADSFPWFKTHLNQAADRFRLQRVRPEEVESLRDYEAKDLLKRYKVPFWKLPFVAKYMRNQMSADIQSVELFPGVPAMLGRLRKDGLTVGIVSSNSEPNVRHVLGPELSREVSYYECGTSMNGKKSKILKVLRQSATDKTNALFIGDEGRDIDAAQKSGVHSGAVTWGYNHVGALEKHKPTFVFSSLDEIISKIENT